MERYVVATWHGEGSTVFQAVDTYQPEDEQPAIVMWWSTRDGPNARFLADDFCRRHNAQEHNVHPAPRG